MAFEIRLFGGPDYNGCGSTSEGRVEVLYNGTWGTICRDDWDLNDAHVVCRMLGYTGALQAVGAHRYGDSCRTIYLGNTDCAGTESDLEECKHTLLPECHSGHIAGVKCERGPWGGYN